MATKAMKSAGTQTEWKSLSPKWKSLRPRKISPKWKSLSPSATKTSAMKTSASATKTSAMKTSGDEDQRDEDQWEPIVVGWFWKSGRPKFKYVMIEKESVA